MSGSVPRFTLVVGLVLALGAAAHGQEGVAPVESSCDYDLITFRGASYVQLELGGARGVFLFDTGANGSAVDRNWVHREEIPFEPAGSVGVQGTTGSMQVARARFERLDLGTGYFLQPVFNLQDFSKFRSPEEGPQVGLLGSDFINRYRTTIDYQGRRVRMALKHERRPLDREAWVPHTLTYRNRIPVINVNVGGLDVPCKLDTGAGTIDERPLLDCNVALVRALRAAGHELVERGSIYVVGASGPETLRLLGGPDGAPLVMRVGARTVRDLILVVHGRGTLAIDYPIALASGSLLARLETLVIDPFDNLLWLPRED